MKTKRKRSNKQPCTKIIKEKIWADNSVWTVQYGELKRPVGNPGKTEHLFRVVAEKIPYDALQSINKDMIEKDLP